MATVVKQEQYPQLDMVGVHASVRAFNVAKEGRAFSFISGLQERIDSASQRISTYTRSLLSECVGLEVVVNSAGFTEILKQWSDINTGAGLTDGGRSSALENVKAVYVGRVRRLVDATTLCKSKIAPLLNDVAALNLEHYADPLMSFDADALERHEALATRLQAKIDELTEDKKILDSAIKALQSKTWWDHVKGILPTADEIEAALAAALVGKVDADLIVVALDRVTKYIDFFESARNFSDMNSAKARITAQLKVEIQALKGNKKEIDALTDRAEKINSYTELLQGRDQWVTTLDNIRSALQQFLEVCELMGGATDEAIRQAPKQQADFLKFLRSLN